LEVLILCRYPERGNHSAETVLQPEDKTGFGQADARRSRDERVEHRPELGTRLADYFEHVCGSSLLLTRFVKLPGEQCNGFHFGICAA
jgi:hypothetical protein